MTQFTLGTSLSVVQAIQHCADRGLRLAYRSDICVMGNEAKGWLRIHNGNAYGGDHWTPVLDGDGVPTRNTDGESWVQVGDVNRLCMNHRVKHGSDPGWGGDGNHATHKGPWIWCVPTPKFKRYRLGNGVGLNQAKDYCWARNLRLAAAEEICSGDTNRASKGKTAGSLQVNLGKFFTGDRWTPVIDGDGDGRNYHNENGNGFGWVQIGNKHKDRQCKSHKVALGTWKNANGHLSHSSWGNEGSVQSDKSPYIWCVPRGTLIKFDIGKRFGRLQAIRYCRHRNLRLAFQHDLCTGWTPRVNQGNRYIDQGDFWTPVLDGGETGGDNEERGWVQMGDNRVCRNHGQSHPATQGHVTWGAPTDADLSHKGPFMWCVRDQHELPDEKFARYTVGKSMGRKEAIKYCAKKRQRLAYQAEINLTPPNPAMTLRVHNGERFQLTRPSPADMWVATLY